MQPNSSGANTGIISKAELNSAYDKIREFLPATPLVKSYRLSQLVGANVYLKLESLQPTHSFKVRGALNSISLLSESAIKAGVVTASGGNHGLGVSYASKVLNSNATVFLPVNTSELKIAALKEIGAKVILHGEAWDEANLEALKLAQSKSQEYIHPFNDRKVMAGQGTIVNEIMESGLYPDTIIASIGGGGLISGIASALWHYSPTSKVVGVETIGADCMSQSIAANRIVELPAITSIADSLGAKKTEALPFEIIKARVSNIVNISDALAIESALELLEKDKLLVEPAASCCIAALSSNKIEFKSGSNIVIIVCGANISLNKLLTYKEKTGESEIPPSIID